MPKTGKKKSKSSAETTYRLTRAEILELAAQDDRVREGDIEIDADAAVSGGGPNGAYVQAWLWVSFE